MSWLSGKGTRVLRHLFPVLLLTFAPAIAKEDWLSCGTYPERTQEALALHRSSQRAGKFRSFRTQAARQTAASRDIGNIAILEDADGVVARLNTFNLSARSVRFLPSGVGYRFETSDGGYDAAQANAGTVVDRLGDDDSRLISLPFAFPFYGRNWNSVYLNSDGNLTFGVGDNSTSARSPRTKLNHHPRNSISTKLITHLVRALRGNLFCR